MPSSDVIVRLRAVGQAAFEGAMESAAKSIGQVDTQAHKADSSTTQMAGSMQKSGKSLKSTVGTLAKWAGGAALVYKGAHYLHSAVEATEDLAKGTMRLQRTTGMEAEQASAWAEITKVRGVETNQFQRGLVALSKQMVAAKSGTTAAVSSFKQLGVSMDAVRAGDTQTVMMQMADGFERMQNPAQRAALAQKLLARQGQELLPLFSSGSKAIQEQLDTAKRYGAVIGQDGVEHTKEFAQQQRNLQMASDGLKVALGESLVPVMLSVANALSKIVAFAQPLLRNSTAMIVLLGTLTAAFVALKVAEIAATISTLGLQASFFLIPLAIIAVIAALVVMYKKVGWFRDGVNAAFNAVKTVVVAVFNWIKGNWPLLLAILGGPFTTAAYLIAKNWDKIKAGARSALDTIKRLWQGLPDFFKGIGRDIVTFLINGIKATPGAVLEAIKGLLPGKLAAKVGDKLGLWQHGGVVPHSQWGVVGENGPELLQLPGGTRITPLSTPVLAPAPALAGAAGGVGRTQTTANFWLDRRLIATAVAEDTADQKARR